jgi:uncharacterized protein YndB with AHSA1/START domain
MTTTTSPTSSASSTDTIRKQVDMKAAPERVWQALTDANQFGTWFRVKMDTPFVVGRHAGGQITHPGYEHIRFEVLVEEMKAPTLFVLRWHPYAIDPKVDYSGEPMTRIEFRLEPLGTGTRLTVTESGFDKIPEHRRAECFRMNDSGWAQQMQNIRAHVDG